MSGTLEAIWLKRVRRGPMDRVEAAELKTGVGLVGNANRGGRRQVTIIEREAWERLTQQVGANLDPAHRRANLMVSGISLAASRGRVLRIGTCRVRILGETKPCEQIEELHPGLRAAMYPNWGGGAFAEVVQEGTIRVGNTIAFEDADALSQTG